MVILVLIITHRLHHTSSSLVKVVCKLLDLQQQRIKFLVHFVLKSKENILSEQAYLDLLQELVSKAETRGFREVRDGHKRCSLFGRQLRFNLEEGFPLMTHKKVFVRGAFEELMWMLRGQTDVQTLEEKKVFIWSLWKDVLVEYGYQEGDLGAIYGESWRNFGEISDRVIGTDEVAEEDIYGGDQEGFDQIEWVINEIKTNPSSSRLIVSAWNPHVHCVEGKAALPPCHTLFQFFVEDSKLSCQLYQRSGDYIIGNPLNIIFYAMLTHIMAQQCNLGVGDFIITFGDVHLYSDQIEMAKEILTRPTYPFPQIEIEKAKDLYSYEWEDVKVLNYVSGDKISIPVAK